MILEFISLKSVTVKINVCVKICSCLDENFVFLWINGVAELVTCLEEISNQWDAHTQILHICNKT